MDLVGVVCSVWTTPMVRPWNLFALLVSISLAVVYEQGSLNWPEGIALALCFALLIWRIAYKLRSGIRAERKAVNQQRL